MLNNAWDVFNTYQAERASMKADQVSMKLDTTKEQVEEKVERLNNNIAHLALLCRAMFELLQERTDITDADLAKKMEEIDLRDGRADGKMTPQIQKCPQCGRTVSPKFNRCLYCGFQAAQPDPFTV